MSLSANLFHAASAFVSAVPVADAARGALQLAATAGALVFFRPLLTGIGRALVLTVRPRRTREELAARRQQAITDSVQRHINTAGSLGDAAELRAMAARG